MNATKTDFSSSVGLLRDASDDGQLAARLFLQSLIDHDDVMDGKEAGLVFCEVVMSEYGAFLKSNNRDNGLARLSGFMCFIGEMLWQQTEPQRQAVAQVFNTPRLQSKVAKVIPIVKVVTDRKKAGSEGGDGQ